MTRDRFETIHERRGYTVERLGKMTILRMTKNHEAYTAYWFWNADGTPDESQQPSWNIERV